MGLCQGRVRPRTESWGGVVVNDLVVLDGEVRVWEVGREIVRVGWRP